MVQDAGADHDVEAFVLDRQIEDIHLREGRAAQSVPQLVLESQSEARQRQIDTQHVIVVERQKIRHLPGAASAFEDQLVVADGVEQGAG